MPQITWIKRWILPACAVCLSTCTCLAQHLSITNPLDVDRTQEVIDLPLVEVQHHLHARQAGHIVALDEASGKPLPTQLFSNMQENAPPDRLLILVQAPARATLHILLRETAHPEEVKPLVSGREAPERKDDFAWENQFVTYRIYGPALQATGEITSGIDVWSKRVPNFVIDTFYKRDLEGQRTKNNALSYHKDNGQGLDSYEVGPSRGCGGTAVFSDGRLWPSKNYASLKMLSLGPIRFAFEVSYAPWDGNGVEVTETKRITLDAGSRLNQIESTYDFQGTQAIDVAAGLAVHKDANPQEQSDGQITSVWDTPQLETAGRIATGMVSIQPHHAELADQHELMLFQVKSGQSIQYAAGSGWSKADMPTQQAWNNYLKLYLDEQQHPLKIRWSH